MVNVLFEPETSVLHTGLWLKLLLSSIYIRGTNEDITSPNNVAMSWRMTKFCSEKICGCNALRVVVDMLNGRASVQKNSQDKTLWNSVDVQSSVGGQNNPMHQSRLSTDWVSILLRWTGDYGKARWVWANSINKKNLSYIKRIAVSRLSQFITPLVKLYLEYCGQFWAPTSRRIWSNGIRSRKVLPRSWRVQKHMN